VLTINSPVIVAENMLGVAMYELVRMCLLLIAWMLMLFAGHRWL